MIRRSVLALAAAATLGAPLSALSECFGPVGRTDTLWLVAIKLRPDPSISPQRMMLALLKENPQAFSGDNVNALNAGSVLCFEEADSIEFDDRAAVEEVRRHNRDWRTGQVAGSGDVAAAEIGPESRADSVVSRAEPPVSANEAEPEGASGAGQRPSGSLDLGQAAATFESRLARMEDRIEKLESAGGSSHATQVSELTPKVLVLETALQGALQRLDRSEREVERLRALASNSGIEDSLASLESRLSALDTALDRIRSAAPAMSAEFGAVSQVVSRLEEDLALLGLRAAHNEEQIRAVVTLLEAESEAIEEFKSRLRRSLRLMSSVSPPGGEIRGFEPPRAPSKDLPAVPESRSVPRAHGTTPAPDDAEAAMEPMPTPAPGGGEAAMEPMPTPAPGGAGAAMEPMPTPAPGGAGAAMEPMPTPAPGGAGAAMEPMPTPAPGGAGAAMEPMPTPAPGGAGAAMEPMPTPAPGGAGAAMEPMPTPAPGGAGAAMEPMPTPAPGGAGAAMEPMPTPAPGGAGAAMEPMPTPAPGGAGAAMEPMPTPAPGGAGAAMEPMPTPAPESGDQSAESAPVQDNLAAPAPAATEPESTDYVTIITDRISNWLSRIRDLW